MNNRIFTSRLFTGSVIAVAVSLAAMNNASATQTISPQTYQSQIDQLRADLNTTYAYVNTKYTEAWGVEDHNNIAALKLDQQRQDDQTAAYVQQGTAAYNQLTASDAAIASQLSATTQAQSERDAGQDTHINAAQDAAQTANVKADNLALRSDNIESQAANLDTRVGKTETRLDTSEQAIRDTKVQADSDRQQQINGDKQNASAISKESEVRATANLKLAAGVSQAQATGDYASSRADQAFSNAEMNSQSIRKTNAVVAEHSAELANHEQRLNGLEQQGNRNYADLRGRIDRVQKRANAGTSSALSSAAIPQVTEYQRFAMGAGVGGYEGESALAVGFSSRLSTNVVMKASVTTDSQHGTGWNVGTSIGW